MRVLFSTTAGAGHFGPLVPFANACHDAGHEVLVAAPASFASAVSSAGFNHAPFDDVPPDVMGAVFGRLPGLPREEANAVVLGEVFARLDAQAALPGVSATIESWKPDVIVREPCEFGSWAAAEKAGVPSVLVWIGLASMAETIRLIVAEPLAELRALAGLPDDAAVAPFDDEVSFTLVPPTFDGHRSGDVDSMFRFREVGNGVRAPRLPEPWGDPDQPLVYATFGSVTATVGPFAAIYPAVVDALAGFPARVLLTTGEGFDATSLGPVPANIHIERWWPQADVMPVASAMIGHGGFGTTMTALAAGLPQVVVPLFASDQFLNAERVAEVGAGTCVRGGADAVGTLPGALRQVLEDPSFRTVASGLADEIASLPDTSAAVPIVERVATGASKA